MFRCILSAALPLVVLLTVVSGAAGAGEASKRQVSQDVECLGFRIEEGSRHTFHVTRSGIRLLGREKGAERISYHVNARFNTKNGPIFFPRTPYRVANCAEVLQFWQLVQQDLYPLFPNSPDQEEGTTDRLDSEKIKELVSFLIEFGPTVFEILLPYAFAG